VRADATVARRTPATSTPNGAVHAALLQLFHFIMEWEGQAHGWLTGLCWTLTVMSTLGLRVCGGTSEQLRKFEREFA